MVTPTFLFAGKALFTATNTVKGTRLTFKITQSKPEPGRAQVYFASVMKGQDNENDYRYIGVVNARDLTLHATSKSKFMPGTPEFEGLKFTLDVIAGRKLSPSLNIQHAGKCGRCGRTLTVPESIESGIGPECAARAAGPNDTKPVRKGRKAAPARTAARTDTGQIVPVVDPAPPKPGSLLDLAAQLEAPKPFVFDADPAGATAAPAIKTCWYCREPLDGPNCTACGKDNGKLTPSDFLGF